MVVFGELEFDSCPEDSLITLLLTSPVYGALAFMDSRNSKNSSLPLVSVRWVLLRETEAVEFEAFDRPDKSSFLYSKKKEERCLSDYDTQLRKKKTDQTIT